MKLESYILAAIIIAFAVALYTFPPKHFPYDSWYDPTLHPRSEP
jgi:hypothetical protein